MFFYKQRTVIATCMGTLFLLSPIMVSAKYDPQVTRGHYTQEFSTPYDEVVESCIIPKHLTGVDYRNQDRKDEAMLCSLDFYGKTDLDMTALTHVAICPKNQSTNPAVELYEIKSGITDIAAYESKQCHLPSKKRNKKHAKRLAKFKQSISCSYTPSILAYYHVSRMLGNMANVPPAVIRTIALERHRKVAKLGYKVAKQYNQAVLKKTWKLLIDIEAHVGSNSNKKINRYTQRIFTKDNQQLFGALQKDVKNENPYKEFYIQNKKNSYQRLTAQPFVKKLISGASKQEASVPMLYQLKDYSDMLIIDYLLSQEDRFGNMTYKDYYYSVDEIGNIERSRVSKKNASYSHEQYAAEEIYKVRRLILKDNDCGVNRSNRTKKSNIMSKIKHLSLNSYQKILALNTKVETGSLENFFKKELLFTHGDWEKFEHSVQSLKQTLQKNCRNGRLQLDLNPERKMLGLPAIDSKSYCDSTG